MLNIGSHISSAKGYEAMGKQAQKLGASTFAFFTRNPRGGSAKEIRPEDAARFREMWKEYGDRVIVAHAPYTLNACSDKEEVRRFARETFASDLERMEYTTVLLETMAGKGSEIGRSFEELRAILDRVELSAKMGICLDTCHVWDAGYDIVNRLDEVLEAFDAVIGLERLKAVHINDSMNPCGSRKDRHARIGEGTIGLEAFGRIVRHPGLRDLPFILETPNDDAGWAEEIRLLRSLAG